MGLYRYIFLFLVGFVLPLPFEQRSPDPDDIAVLVIACNRPTVRDNLQSVLEYHIFLAHNK